MNSKLCLSLISNSTSGTYAYSLNLNLLWTLLLSVFIITPSFADNDLKNKALGAKNSSSISANNSLFAQTFVIPTDGKAITKTIINCTADNEFTDDGGFSIYKDDVARTDTIAICPNNSAQRVKLAFTDFDLEEGDTLVAYDGNLSALKNNTAPLIGKASGVGNSQAFGAWIMADCSPATNPSGCLTFVFNTDGDYRKGAGWEAWGTCEDRKIVIKPPSITNPLLTCSETSRFQTIGAATVSGACGAVTNDSTRVTIANAAGTICVDTCLSRNANMSVTREFALGTYVVTYRLKGDPSISAVTYFSINAPNLICNDEVRIPLGSDCGVFITPDMILENPCDTITDTLYYQIKIIGNDGKILAQGTGRAGDYPSLTKGQIGGCNNRLRVEITRVYFDGLNLAICNNGRQAATCSTNIQFVDNSPPIFNQFNSVDTVFACATDLSAESLQQTVPMAFDNCNQAQVVYQGARKISNGTDCDETTYEVTWTATDNCGNVATLRNTVRVMRPTGDKIIKAPDVTLICGIDPTSAALDLNRTGAPSLVLGVQRNGVFTPTDTVALSTEEYICKYRLLKEDVQIPSECGQKLFRYWTLIDWCENNGPIPIDTQAIIFEDTFPPKLQCSSFNTLASAEKIPFSPFECTRQLNFSKPIATDNCGAPPAVAEYIVERLENDDWWNLGSNLNQAGALNAGTYRVGYRAFDLCNQQVREDSCFRYFVLEDQTKPSAICTDGLNVSISNDFARVAARDIDAGSWDACGIERILVRRRSCTDPNAWLGSINNYVRTRLNNQLDPTGWGDFIEVECCDSGQKIEVELLVIDNNGNYNFCWMEITTEDKIPPVCSNLPNQQDFCDNFHNGEFGASTDTDNDKQFDAREWQPLEGDLADAYNEKYGNPLSACVDNLTCQALTLEQQYQLIDEECGIFRVKRRYRVRDVRGSVSNWSEQLINIEYRPDWKITLPVDWIGTCGDGVPTEELLIENGFCDAMAYEAFDQKFNIVNDACFKVIRTYHIINWCIYQAGDEPVNINRLANSAGNVMSQQTISSAQYQNIPYLTYTQILKVSDSEAPVVTVAEVEECIGEENQCSATKTFSATATDCNEASTNNLNFNWEIFENNVQRGSGAAATFNWVVQPGVNYKVKWKVADKCGNSAWTENIYTFKDCYKPTVYCLDGLAIELGTSKEVEIWAKDFNVKSLDNCTNEDKLAFRIWHNSLPTEAPTTLEGVLALSTRLGLDCDYVGIQNVNVYVIDEAGNYDFCITTLNVQDNMNVCPTTGGQIAGRIYTEYGSAVQNTEVRIANADNSMMMTPANGNYSFDLTGSPSYTVVPSKNTGFLNGVSTFDMVKITKHILRKEVFTSPYQYIAADVNNSGDISTFDIIQLRKLILNLITEFPNDNPSWRFVDANYEFSTENPSAETFPEYIQVNNLSGVMPDLDFIAVKIGDINGSAAASSLTSADSRTKEGNLVIEVADKMVKTGEIVEVAFNATEFKNIEGYQFTLQYEGLEFVAFGEELATEANFGFGLQDRGYLVTSWNNTTADENDNAPTLFRLKLKATTNGSLLSMLKINSKFAESESYHSDGTLQGVTLQAAQKTAEVESFKVAQNTPNPFANQTIIGFALPNAAEVELNIIDLQGKVILTRKEDFSKGQQQIAINANELPNGTYYYQLVTPFGVAAKKMIVLK